MNELLNPPEAGGTSGTKLLDKALDLVDLVAQSERRLTAAHIATATGHSKPTVSRILSALVRRGMLTFDRRDNAYELGLKFSELAATINASHRVVALIEDDLIRLSIAIGETISLGVPEPDGVQLIGRYNFGLQENVSIVSGRRPYHASAIGKVTLAYSDPKFARAFFRRSNLIPLTHNTLIDMDKLRQDIEITQARGYAIDDEEIVAGVRCVARALFDGANAFVGAVSVSGPAHRMQFARLEQINADLDIIADALRKRLRGALDQSSTTRGFQMVREGGLYDPIALVEAKGAINIVDAAAPALVRIATDGAALSSTPLPIHPKAAAFDSEANVLLAHGSQFWVSGDDGFTVMQSHDREITALCHTPRHGWIFGDIDGRIGSFKHTAPFAQIDGYCTAICMHGQNLVALSDRGELIRISPDAGVIDRVTLPTRSSVRSSIASDGKSIWIAHSSDWQMERITLSSKIVTIISAPEYSTPVVALGTETLWCAGSNLKSGNRRGGSAPGSLYYQM